MLEIALPNPSRSQLWELLLPITVISDAAPQDCAAPDLTFRGFNNQQATLLFALLIEAVVPNMLDCGFFGLCVCVCVCVCFWGGVIQNQ